MTKTRTATERRRRQALTDMATATEGERRPPGPNRGSGASQLSSRQTCNGRRNTLLQWGLSYYSMLTVQGEVHKDLHRKYRASHVLVTGFC